MFFVVRKVHIMKNSHKYSERIKRIVSGLLVGAAFLVFAGCGKDDAQDLIHGQDEENISEISEEESFEINVEVEETENEDSNENIQTYIVKTELPEFEVTEEDKLFYMTWLDENITILVENIDEAEYGFYDVNYDGNPELIVREPMYTYVLGKQGDDVVSLTDETQYTTLLPNGMLMRYEFSSDSEKYSFYVIADEKYELVQSLYRENLEEGDNEGNGIYGADGDKYVIGDKETDSNEWLEELENWLVSFDGYDETNTDEYYYGYSYYFAEVNYTKYSGSATSALPYTTPEAAYLAFFSGECGACFSEDYTEFIEYRNMTEDVRNCWYFYDLINNMRNVNGGSWLGGAIEWALIDCGNDGNKELLLKVNDRTADAFYTYVVLQYRNSKLYICHAANGWNRSDLQVDEYGWFRSYGSGGASLHYEEEYIIDANGVKQDIYDGMICASGYQYTEDEEVQVVVLQWIEDYEASGKSYFDHEVFGPLVMERYGINHNVYYNLWVSDEVESTAEQIANQKSIIAAFENAGIKLYTSEQIKELIATRQKELGIAEWDGQDAWLGIYKDYEYFVQ